MARKGPRFACSAGFPPGADTGNSWARAGPGPEVPGQGRRLEGQGGEPSSPTSLPETLADGLPPAHPTGCSFQRFPGVPGVGLPSLPRTKHDTRRTIRAGWAREGPHLQTPQKDAPRQTGQQGTKRAVRGSALPCLRPHDLPPPAAAPWASGRWLGTSRTNARPPSTPGRDGGSPGPAPCPGRQDTARAHVHRLLCPAPAPQHLGSQPAGPQGQEEGEGGPRAIPSISCCVLFTRHSRGLSRAAGGQGTGAGDRPPAAPPPTPHLRHPPPSCPRSCGPPHTLAGPVAHGPHRAGRLATQLLSPTRSPQASRASEWPLQRTTWGVPRVHVPRAQLRCHLSSGNT